MLAATPVVGGLFASLAAAAPTGSSAAPGGLPPEVRVYFTPEEFVRSQAYTEGRYWLAAAGIGLRLGGLLLLVCTPAAAALRRLALRWARGRPLVATVVLDATLLRHNDPYAVATVVAHELGHWQCVDIWKGIGLSWLGLAGGFWYAARVLAG